MKGLKIHLARGVRLWKYERRIAGSWVLVRLTLGPFPAFKMADAREWADKANAKVEAGIDPREEAQAKEARETMTTSRAHELYMEVVREACVAGQTEEQA